MTCPRVTKVLACAIFLFCTILADDIKIAPVVDSTVAQAGLDNTREVILGMQEELQELMDAEDTLEFVNEPKFRKLGDVYAAHPKNVSRITAAITVTQCSRTLTDIELMKIKFPYTMGMMVLERGCSRPPLDVGFGVPYLKSMFDIVPFLIDARSDPRLIEKWDDIIILHDNTLELNNLETIVSVIQTTGIYRRSTSVTMYNLCSDNKCEDMSNFIHELLLPHSKLDFPKYYLTLAAAKTIGRVLEQAKGLDMLDIDRRWLFVNTGTTDGNNFILASLSNFAGAANIAIAYRKTPAGTVTDVDCIEEVGCQVSIILKIYAKSVEEVIRNGLYDLSNNEESAMTKARITQTMLKHLYNEKTCGGCVEYVIKNTAYYESGKRSANILDDYETTGTWTLFGGLKMSGDLYPLTTNNLRGRLLKIGITDGAPGAIVTKKEDGSYEYRGFLVDFIEVLKKEMNFTYKFFVPEDGQTGRRQHNGEWTGMIRQIKDKQVELAAQCFFLTPDRYDAVNFTMAIDDLAYGLLVKRPLLEHRYLFLAPFTSDTWICVFVAVFVIGPVLYLVHRASVYYDFYDMKNDKGLFRLTNCAWYTFGAIVQQGGVHLPWAFSGRMLVGFWWIFVIVTVTTYSGNLVAVLTFPKIRTPINNFNELLSSRGVKWGVFDGEAIIEILDASSSPMLKTIRRGLQIFDPKDKLKVISKVRGGGLVLMAPKYQLQQLMSADYNRTKECRLSIGSGDVMMESVSLAVQKNWPHLEAMNKEISRIFETGLFIKWRRNSLPPDNECTVKYKPQAGDSRKINVEQMIGSFYILMIGLLSGLVALGIEYLHVRYKNKGTIPEEYRGLVKNFKFLSIVMYPGLRKSDSKKKLMQDRMYSSVKQDSKAKRRRRKRMSSTKVNTLSGNSKEFLGEEWENRRNIQDDTVGYDEYGRRDIYNNFDNRDDLYNENKSYPIRRNYDNPNFNRQGNDLSAESDREQDKDNNRGNDDNYFTYGGGGGGGDNPRY